MNYDSNITKEKNDTLNVKFYYEDESIPKPESVHLDEKEAKKFGSMNLVFNKKRIVIVGLGKKQDLTHHKTRNLGSNVYKAIKDKTEAVFFEMKGSFDEKQSLFFIEGLNLATYQFSKYRSESKKPRIRSYNFDIAIKDTKKELKRLDELRRGVFLVRDLVNEPSNAINPTSFEALVNKITKTSKDLKVSVLKYPDLVKKGMGGIINVGKGSKDAPRMIIIEYNPLKTKKHVALVGKGVTFDSGGYNIKPTGYMEDMKMDMAGAATVLGTILTAQKLGIKKNIKAYLPLVENMISDKAYRPGDIIKTYMKKTIEVSNTDAEGRLILVDALAYANEQKPDCILDFATLTGAIIIALGNTITGVMTNNDALYQSIFQSSASVGEKIWQLPLYEEHEESLKTDYADLKSIGYTSGKGAASSITAAALLKQFVGKTPWAHFDIAGTAYSNEERDSIRKGGTGAMLRTMIDWLEK